MLGEAPSTAMLTDLVTKANAGSTIQELADSLATNASFTSQFPVWQTAKEFTTKVVANMFAGGTVSQADTDAAIDYIAGAITAGTFTKTSAVVALTSYMASADGVANATYGSVSQAYQNKVEVAEYYTITKGQGDASAAERKAAIANVTDAADAVATEKTAVDSSATAAAAAEVAAQSKSAVFTTGIDNLTGSVGNDTFSGAVNKNNAVGSTAQPGDVVAGGAGTDTFNLSVAGDAGGAHSIQAITTTGVENLMISNYDINAAETTLDTSLMSGLAKVGLFSSGATGNTTIAGLTSITDATMNNGASNLTMTYAAGTTGTADTQNLSIGGLTNGTFTANGLETIAVTGSLSASKMANITGTGTTKITIGGDQNFTMTGATTIKTIDAGANTGKTSLTLGANAAHVVTLGAGDDTLHTGTTMGPGDKLQGGDGTDTLVIESSGTVNGPATAADLTAEFLQTGGFETLNISPIANTTLAMAKIGDVTQINAAAGHLVTFTGDNGGQSAAATISFTLDGVAKTSTADLSGNAAADAAAASAAVAATINGTAGYNATATATTVAVTREGLGAPTIAVTDQTGAQAAETNPTLSVSGLTTQGVDIYQRGDVTLRLTDSSGTEDAMNIGLRSALGDRATAQTLNLLDVQDTIETLNFSTAGMKAGTLKTITTLTSDNSTTAINFTGSDDLAIGTLTAAKVVTIDAAAYTGDLTLPAISGAGAQTITTGTGNDTIAMGTLLTGADTIDAGGNTAETSGAGVDTVTLGGNLGSTVAATIPNISNAEVVQQAVGTNFASYIDGSKLTSVGEYAFSGTTGPLVLTNMPAGMEIGVGIAAVEMVSTLSYSLADATGTEDALTIDYSDAVDQVSTNALTTTGVETLNVKASKEALNAVTSTLTLTNAGVATINVTDGHAGDTLDLGTLNKATTTVTAGANKGMIDLVAAATSPGMTVSAPAAVIHAITLSAKADTMTLTGKMADVTNAIAGGASATGTVDVFNGTMTTNTTDLTSITGFETLNLTATNSVQVGLDASGEDGALQTASTVNILGGNANSSLSIATAQFDDGRTVTTPLKLDMSGFAGPTDVQFASDALDAFTTVVGSPQADHIKTIVAAAVAATGNNPTMSGVEQLTVTTTDGDLDGSMSLAKVTGLTRLNVTYDTNTSADTIAFTGLAATTPVYVNSNHTSDSLSATLGSATGSADPLNLVVIGNTGTLDVNSAGVEVLNITTVTAGGTFDIGGVSASTGATQTVTVSGPAAVTLNSVHTSVATINAAAASGGLTVANLQRDADALTVTGGPSSDFIAMENVADVLDGGSNPTASASVGDTLEIVTAAILGGITVDLSAADQVTTMDGGANAAVQTGFEHVDLRGFTNFGAVVTGNDGVNVITGTPAADRLSGGKGADVFQQVLTDDANTDQINGGAGADTINVLAGNYVPAADSSLVSVETIVVSGAGNLTLTTQTDNFTITADTGANIVTGSQGNDSFTGGAGADTFFVAPAANFGYDNVIMDTVGTAVDIVSFSGAKGIGAVNITNFGGAGTDLFKVKADFAGGLTNNSINAYLEDAIANADGATAPATSADTVIQLTQVVNAAASTAITNFQAAPSATTEAALVAAIVGSTGSNEAFDGGLHANYDDAGDVVVFLVQDADESVAFTYTAGAGAGTADTTLEVAEVDIIAVFDSVVTVALIAAQT
jgi:S-layer protein